MRESQKDQALRIINQLTRELKETKKQVDMLNNEIYRLKSPPLSINDNTRVNVDSILEEAKEAMNRNVKRIQKEIENAKSE